VNLFYRWRSTLALVLVAALLSGCSLLDPNVRKQKYYDSGLRYFQKGQYQEAAIQFTNAIKIDSGYADAHFQLGESYLRLQRLDRAYQELSRTVELRPDDYKARIALANVLIVARQFPKAKEQTDWLQKNRAKDPATHSTLSNLLSGEGDIAGAIAEMQQTISLDPGHWELFLGLGFLEQRNSQPDLAEASFKKAIELNSKSAQPRVVLGNFYAGQKRTGDAEQQFRDAVAVEPKSLAPREALARLLLITGRRADGEEVLKQAQRDLPNEPGPLLALSSFYYAIGDLDKAVAEYDALYQQRPKDLQIKKRYIQLLIVGSRVEQARKLNDEILKESPNDQDALVYRSQMQISWGDLDRAIDTLQTVVKNDPKDSLAHFALGVAFERQGTHLEHAESEWREALRLNPDNIEATRALAGAAMRLGDMATLQDAATRIIRLQPGSPDGYGLRALASINQQHFPEAEEDIQKALAIAPQRPIGYVYLGQLRLAQRQFPEAGKAFQAALDRSPNLADALRGLMGSWIAQKQTDKAIEAARAQIAKSPNNSSFYDMLGSVLFFDKKDMGEVVAAFEKAVALDKQNFLARIHLIQAHASRGETDQAIALGERSLQDNPRQPDLFVLMGDLYQAKHDPKKAEIAYQKALTINSQNPVASNQMARLMLSNGENLDLALGMAQTAGKGLPNSPIIADTLGWIYYRKGVYPMAVNYLKHALELQQKNSAPDNPDVHYHLGWAYEKSQQPALARQQFEQVLKTTPNYPAADEIKKELAHLKP
jgi:tetratricopeptide (TPR) repeat protein